MCPMPDEDVGTLFFPEIYLFFLKGDYLQNNLLLLFFNERLVSGKKKISLEINWAMHLLFF